MHELDISVFRAINHGPEFASGLMVFLSQATKYAAVDVVLGLLFIALMFVPRLRRPALVAVIGCVIANTICDQFKHGLQVLRPSVELMDTIRRVDGGLGYGTVSAHSANMMAVAIAFMWIDRRWGWPWFVVAILTGISRIYVGVHYPSQVVYGWTLGATVATLLTLLANRIWPEKPSESPVGASKDPYLQEYPEPDR